MSCAFGVAAAASAQRASPACGGVARERTRPNTNTRRTGGASRCASGEGRGERGSACCSSVSSGIARWARDEKSRRGHTQLHATRGSNDFAETNDTGGDVRQDRNASRNGAGDASKRSSVSSSSSSGKTVESKNGQETPQTQATQSPKPPTRGTGIKREQDIAIDFGAEDMDEVDEFGNSLFLKSGVDAGAGGYKCRWTVRGRASGDGTWEHRETHWEKCDWNGYKELGAELSGFNQEGDAWWETWREVYKPGGGGGRAGTSREQDSDANANADDDDNERIERGADKWARDKTGKEWHEKWWEKFERTGASERSVEKSGRQGIQAWWEKWGEQRDPAGSPNASAIKWTDKWAENGVGTRWGDKWEERFRRDGSSSKKVGETWRVGAGGERWSRTWGETVGENGQTRKYGKSTSGERWDTLDDSSSTQSETVSGKNDDRQNDGAPFDDVYGWPEAVKDSTKLLAIEINRDGEKKEK